MLPLVFLWQTSSKFVVLNIYKTTCVSFVLFLIVFLSQYFVCVILLCL